MAKIIAVAHNEFDLYGCPQCGYQSGQFPAMGRGTGIFQCGECKMTSVILGEGVTLSSIGIGTPVVRPVLEVHPRKGIPKHGDPDTRPAIASGIIPIDRITEAKE